MKSISFRNLSLASLLLIALAGCDRSPTAAAPVAATPAAAPAPVAATSAPVATADAEYYVEAPPPALQAEVRIASPGPGYTWVGGYWGVRDRRHDWVPGHWERPPEQRREWVEPRWERRGRGYVFVKGYWR